MLYTPDKLCLGSVFFQCDRLPVFQNYASVTLRKVKTTILFSCQY